MSIARLYALGNKRLNKILEHHGIPLYRYEDLITKLCFFVDDHLEGLLRELKETYNGLLVAAKIQQSLTQENPVFYRCLPLSGDEQIFINEVIYALICSHIPTDTVKTHNTVNYHLIAQSKREEGYRLKESEILYLYSDGIIRTYTRSWLPLYRTFRTATLINYFDKGYDRVPDHILRVLLSRATLADKKAFILRFSLPDPFL